MKKFHFNLESLLTIRGWEEQEAQQQLAAANAQVQRIDDRLAALGKSIEQAYDGWNRQGSASFSPFDRMNLVSQVSQAEHEIDRAKRERESALDKRARAMKAVVEASKKLKVVANLKDKRFREYQAEVFRQDAIEIENVFNARRHNS